MIKEGHKYKMVLFDFDDTLCVHLHHVKDHPGLKNFFCDENPYEDCSSNKQLKDFMGILDARLGLISKVENGAVEIEAKMKWAADTYGYEFENFCVTGSKAEMIEAIINHYGYERSDVLLIDDSYNVLRECDEFHGFDCCTPLEVVNLMNKLQV